MKNFQVIKWVSGMREEEKKERSLPFTFLFDFNCYVHEYISCVSALISALPDNCILFPQIPPVILVSSVGKGFSKYLSLNKI